MQIIISWIKYVWYNSFAFYIKSQLLETINMAEKSFTTWKIRFIYCYEWWRISQSVLSLATKKSYCFKKILCEEDGVKIWFPLVPTFTKAFLFLNERN